MGDDAGVDVGKFVEAGLHVGGQDRSGGGAGGGRDDEVVRAAASACTCGVGEQVGVVLGNSSVVVADRYNGQDLVEECLLRGLPAGVGIEVHAREVFGYCNGGDGDVGVIGNGGPSADGGDEDGSVQD